MDEADIPKSFFCPITSMVMRDPVVDTEGNSYERAAIEEWLSRNATSPVTRQPLTKDQLKPNRALKDVIDHMEAQFKGQGLADPFANIKAMTTSLPPASPHHQNSMTSIEITEEQLTDFYERVAPENVKNVLQYLQAYQGKHQSLADDLFKKYQQRPESTEVAAPVSNDTVTMVIQPGQDLVEGQLQKITVMTSIRTPEGVERTPSDICCVVDVSGSMGSEATMKAADGSNEGHGKC